MVSKVLVAAAALVIGLSNWLNAVDHTTASAAEAPAPRRLEPLLLTGKDADQRRTDLLRRASVRVGGDIPAAPPVSSCHYLPESPSGTTAKFDCLLDNGAIVKVKYGRNPEIHAEAAGTRLLQALGYPADTVIIVPRLRCYDCPRFPFAGAYVRSNPITRHLLVHHEGYTEFEWVAVERKFPAHPIETASKKGWHWWELEKLADESTGVRQAELHALNLLAVFLAHWDNKGENQRLVCLDAPQDGDCQRPLALIHDLGSSFGPTKANLARWRELPIWDDPATCAVSMRALPHEGATFEDTVISEAGRALLAERLAAIGDDEVRALFAYARFPQFQSGTDDAKDLDAWGAAFRFRVNQILQTRCPV